MDAVHVTITYHETFRETVLNIEAWNRWFERFPNLIFQGRTAEDVQRRPRHRAHGDLLRRAEPQLHRG